MISPWTIYLIGILDNVQQACLAMSVFGGIAASIIFILTTLEQTFDEWKKCFAIALVVFLIGSVGAIFTPSSKSAAAIYLIPKIANNEQVQQVPENALRLLNTKLQEWLQDSIIRGDAIAEKAGQPKVSTDVPEKGTTQKP